MSRAHKPGSVEIDGQGRAFFVEACGKHVPYDRQRHYPRVSRYRLRRDDREMVL